VPAGPVGSGDPGHRADLPRQGVGRRPLAQRRPGRSAARNRLVGLRALASRAMAAVPELQVVSRPLSVRGLMRRPLLAVAIAAAVAVGALAAIVVMHPVLSADVTVQDDIQAANLGPLTSTFPFFTWLGGPGGIYMQVFVLLCVLLLNRRAWRLALAALFGGLSYLSIVNLVN